MTWTPPSGTTYLFPWENNEAGGTPLDAANLDEMQQNMEGFVLAAVNSLPSYVDTSIAAALGGATSPTNTGAPVLSGSLTVGDVLSCTPGTWSEATTGITYQAQRSSSEVGTFTNVSTNGGTTDEYTTQAADEGDYFRYAVTATFASGGPVTAYSNVVGPVVAAAESAPVFSALPAVAGTVRVGQTLTTTNGTCSGSPSYAYQWYRQTPGPTPTATAISGATASTYSMASADVGNHIYCEVTATNDGGSANASSPVTPDQVVQIGGTGTIYYVSNSGSDSANGTTTSTPFETVNKVNHLTLNPGDTVLFEAGQTFSDTSLSMYSSGTVGDPVCYGKYGSGADPILSAGGFFNEEYNYIQVADLVFGGQCQFGSTANSYVVEGMQVIDCTINMPSGNTTLGINANATASLVQGGAVNNAGQSCIQIYGSNNAVLNVTISNPGATTPAAESYHSHGIYLDSSSSEVGWCTITGTPASTSTTNSIGMDSGVSCRYHSAYVHDNTISGADIAIDFYESDETAGTSYWINNTIETTAVAGLYVNSGGGTYALAESFVIQGNEITSQSASGWVDMNIGSTTGTVTY